MLKAFILLQIIINVFSIFYYINISKLYLNNILQLYVHYTELKFLSSILIFNILLGKYKPPYTTIIYNNKLYYSNLNKYYTSMYTNTYSIHRIILLVSFNTLFSFQLSSCLHTTP